MKHQAVANYLRKTLDTLRRAATKELDAGHINSAMVTLSAAAQLLYKANMQYTDTELEDILARMASNLPKSSAKPIADRILFYDGFGLNNRGLIQIYLKALCRLGHVVYVTHSDHKAQLPDVLRILESTGSEAVWLKENSSIGTARELCGLFSEYAPQFSFLYTTPNDVPALAAFQRQAGTTQRFQINLTDHAYWLGTAAFDTCIEFRDYGASISRVGRGISPAQLVKLPFYPAIDFQAEFQGFPGEFPPNTKIVFSGGSLYKTLGGGNKYYQLIEYILSSFSDAVFWYAGSGDSTELDKLAAGYPGRVIHTAERQDLYQVLTHCFLYLSTYPLCGGLMFQYAASAGKIPVTLRYDDVSDDFLLNQDTLGIQFESMEAIQQELDRLFTDECYRMGKERAVQNSVLNQADFEAGLASLLKSGQTGYPIVFKTADTSAFRSEYLSNLSKTQLAQSIATAKYKVLLRYIPFVYIRGAAAKLFKKLEAKWK